MTVSTAPSPSIAGLLPHELADWLPEDDDSQPDWLRDLGARHRAAVQAHDEAVQAVVDAEEGFADEARNWRVALRQAVSVGDEPPVRPFDPEQQQAQVEVAREDAVSARDALAQVVIDALAEMRPTERRNELAPHLGTASRALALGLRDGPCGWSEGIRKALHERLAELDARDPAGVTEIDDHTGDDEEGRNADHI